ncbi:hypothetical protein, partial [Thermus scotoductus]|uniref:hypothetical protein n=1 Tax=Thermus scotoductus TaxID=37636 RepID=UPI00100361E1
MGLQEVGEPVLRLGGEVLLQDRQGLRHPLEVHRLLQVEPRARGRHVPLVPALHHQDLLRQGEGPLHLGFLQAPGAEGEEGDVVDHQDPDVLPLLPPVAQEPGPGEVSGPAPQPPEEGLLEAQGKALLPS